MSLRRTFLLSSRIAIVGGACVATLAFADEPGHTEPAPVNLPAAIQPMPDHAIPVMSMPGVPAMTFAHRDDTFRVDLDHTGVLRLPAPAGAVVVGNPDVADIAVHSTDTLLVLGRSYGSTNVLAMDAVGRVIGDYTVTVGAREADSKIRVFQGGDRYTYSCSPSCNPAPELGDNDEHVKLFRPEAPQINNVLASPGAATAPSASIEFGEAPVSPYGYSGEN